jgi:hypothetical protein
MRGRALPLLIMGHLTLGHLTLVVEHIYAAMVVAGLVVQRVSLVVAHVDTSNQPRALRCYQCFAGVEQPFEGTLSPSLRPYCAEFHVQAPLPASVLAPTWQIC